MNTSSLSWLPNYWYRYSPLHLILWPISLILRALAGLRRYAYRRGWFKSYALSVPVIVVGNISVGGTGKTPLTLALARYLSDQGLHPVIVSRGYGGENILPLQVQANHPPLQVGDEPLLMAQRNICPVWIGRDRVTAGMAALAQYPKCNVILCDDGLQHYRLQRQVEIVVVDGARRFGNGCLLPAGPLREPVSRLQNVDAVVVNGGQVEQGQFLMSLQGVMFYNLSQPQQCVPAAHFANSCNHAIAGIGHPERFFATLTGLGIPHHAHPFSDHYPYSNKDLIYENADAILMTEKDAVKCAAFADARCWVLRVDAQLDASFFNLILQKLNHHGCKIA